MRKVNSIFLTVVFLICVALSVKASVHFGTDKPFLKQNVSKQGQFFATGDYGYQVGKKDPHTFWTGHPLFTRGTKEGAQVPDREPWLSPGNDILFGLKFNRPIKVDKWKSGPVKVDRLIMQWRSTVPGKGCFGGFIVDDNGNRIRLPIDKNNPIYPYDVTDVRFKPTTVKALYLGVKDSPVEVERIILLPAWEKKITNCMTVMQNECYNACFSNKVPGKISCVIPWNPGINIRYIRHASQASKDLFMGDIFPFLFIDGKKILPSGSDNLKIEETPAKDTVSFSLEFNAPSGKLSMGVNMIFTRDENKGIVIKYHCDTLPEKAKIGFSVTCEDDVFKGSFPKEKSFKLTGNEFSFDSTLGPLEIKLSGADTIIGKRSSSRVVLSSLTNRKELTVDILPPFLSKIKYPTPPFTWYDSPADNGIGTGVAPFKPDDLALLETIEFWKSDQQNKIYDITDDPLVKHLGNKKWQEKHGIYNFTRDPNFMKSVKFPPTSQPLVDIPKNGKVPLVDINGKKCRAIGDYYGSFLRCPLKTDFKRGVPYLIVIEHAFDKLRRGTFGIQSYYVNASLHGALDTGVLKHDGKFHRENLMFMYPKANLKGDFFRTSPSFFWISNAWKWHGWLKAYGPAIRKVEIYQIKKMPDIFLKTNLPENKDKRHLGILTQSPTIHTIDLDSRRIGFDQVWVNIQPPGCLNSNAFSRTDLAEAAFQPGTIEGYKWMLERFKQNGDAKFKVFLSHLLRLGASVKEHSRTGFSRVGTTEPAPCYEADGIPFKPNTEEWKFIAESLKNAMEKLGSYSSLDTVCTGEYIFETTFSFRNVSDFLKDTDIKMKTSPVPEENMRNILEATPEVLKQWLDWAGKSRFAKNKMILDELRKYRQDVKLMLNAAWINNYIVGLYYFTIKKHDKSMAITMEKAGIKNLGDFIKLLGFDWKLYKNIPGFAFQIRAPYPAMTTDNYGWRIPGPKFIPDFYKEPWFKEFKDSFEEGLAICLRLCYIENKTPFKPHSAYFMKNKTEMRRALVQAAMQNPRYIYLSSYVDPWKTRASDVRTFAIPFRLLPFSKAEPSDISVSTEKSITIRKHGNRYALFNTNDEHTDTVLTLPEGQKEIYDLSNGWPHKLETFIKDGKTSVKIGMDAWSLKILSFQKQVKGN